MEEVASLGGRLYLGVGLIVGSTTPWRARPTRHSFSTWCIVVLYCLYIESITSRHCLISSRPTAWSWYRLVLCSSVLQLLRRHPRRRLPVVFDARHPSRPLQSHHTPPQGAKLAARPRCRPSVARASQSPDPKLQDHREVETPRRCPRAMCAFPSNPLRSRRPLRTSERL